MAERRAQLDVRIEAEPDADGEELVALAVRLCEWLLPVGVESVGFVAVGPAPLGAGSVGMFVVGVLAVLFARSSELWGKLVDVVQSWLSSSGARSVRLEFDGDVLEVPGIAGGDQRGLIRTWIDRHAGG